MTSRRPPWTRGGLELQPPILSSALLNLSCAPAHSRCVTRAPAARCYLTGGPSPCTLSCGRSLPMSGPTLCSWYSSEASSSSTCEWRAASGVALECLRFNATLRPRSTCSPPPASLIHFLSRALAAPSLLGSRTLPSFRAQIPCRHLPRASAHHESTGGGGRLYPDRAPLAPRGHLTGRQRPPLLLGIR